MVSPVAKPKNTKTQTKEEAKLAKAAKNEAEKANKVLRDAKTSSEHKVDLLEKAKKQGTIGLETIGTIDPFLLTGKQIVKNNQRRLSQDRKIYPSNPVAENEVADHRCDRGGN